MKENKRKIYIFLLALGLVIVVTGFLIIILPGTFFKTRIIIKHNIRVLQTIRRAGLITLLIGTPFALGGAIPLITSASKERRQLAKQQSQQDQQARLLAKYAKNSSDPVLTKKVLMSIRDSFPESEEIIDLCFQQMEQIDRYQDKQQLLINTNNAHYLSDTMMVFDEVEQKNCRSFQAIANLFIAADDLSDLDIDKIGESLEANKRRLDQIQDLLQISVVWINDFNAGDDNVEKKVQAWITTITETLQREEEEEDEE